MAPHARLAKCHHLKNIVKFGNASPGGEAQGPRARTGPCRYRGRDRLQCARRLTLAKKKTTGTVGAAPPAPNSNYASPETKKSKQRSMCSDEQNRSHRGKEPRLEQSSSKSQPDPNTIPANEIATDLKTSVLRRTQWSSAAPENKACSALVQRSRTQSSQPNPEYAEIEIHAANARLDPLHGPKGGRPTRSESLNRYSREG